MRSEIFKWYCIYAVAYFLLAGSNAAVKSRSNEEDSLWTRVSEHNFEFSSCLFTSDSQAYDHLNYFCHRDWKTAPTGAVRVESNTRNTFKVVEYICDQSQDQNQSEQNCKIVSLFLFKADIYDMLCISSSTKDLIQEDISLNSTVYHQYFPKCVKPYNESQIRQHNQERKKFSCVTYDYHSQTIPLVFSIVGYDVSINSIWNVTLQINIINKCKVFTLNIATYSSEHDSEKFVSPMLWFVIAIGTIIAPIMCCVNCVLEIRIKRKKLKSDPLQNTKNHRLSSGNSSSITPVQETNFIDSDGSQVHQLNVTTTPCPELHLQEEAFITIQDTISSSSSSTTSTISNFPPDTISIDSINTQQISAIDRDHNLSSLNTISSSSSLHANVTNDFDMSSPETVSTCPGSKLQQAVNVTSSSSSISTGSEPQEAS